MGTVRQRGSGSIAASLAAALIMAACTGSDPASLDLGDTTSAAVQTSPPTTVAPSTSTTSSTTTEPSATTTTSLEDLEAQIRADFARIIETRLLCGQDPANCPISEITVAGSPYSAFLSALMTERSQQNLRSRPGYGDFKYRVDTIAVGSNQREQATVTTCQVDSIVLFDVGPQGELDPGIVFDDSTVSARTEWELKQVDEIWLLWDARVLAETIGPDLCTD